MTEAQKEAREALIEQATWALIDYDTDVADRGVSDEHYRERRADVERVFPILASRAPQPTEDDADLPDPLQRIYWYSCTTTTRTRYCEEHHRRSITVGELLARRAPAEPAVTDEMVERGLKVSREFPRKRGLDNARNVMRAVLEAALNGADDE